MVDTWIALDTMPEPTPLFMVLRELEPKARGGALEHVVASLVEREGIDATLDFVRGLPKQSVMGGARELTTELFARTAVVLLDHGP